MIDDHLTVNIQVFRGNLHVFDWLIPANVIIHIARVRH
jgi:aminopeptidase-like protein